MPEQIMFTEEEFKMLEQGLDLVRGRAKEAPEFWKRKVSVIEPFLSQQDPEKFESAKKEFHNDYTREMEDATILSVKLLQIKRAQRQQGVQSETTVQV